MTKNEPILVAGATGLVGSAIVRRLEADGVAALLRPSHAELDLRDGNAVDDYFARHRPGAVYLAAARVGGILANSSYPADFIYDNLAMQTAVIHAAWRHGVKRLLFLGSSCIYPRECPQPMREESLLTGPLEPTNEAYAVAKIAGVKMVDAFNRQHGLSYTSVMPTNLYGPNDHYDLERSHVLPALLRKAHEAKRDGAPTMTVWGTGTPRRELMHVDDMADACVFLMEQTPPGGLVNIGSGQEVSIRELAELVCEVVGFAGGLRFDPSRPDGTPRKLLDTTRLTALGWRPRISLRDGIADAYRDFLERFGEDA